jgi:hypothetical protein
MEDHGMKKTTARIGVGTAMVALTLAGAPAVTGASGNDKHGEFGRTLHTIAELDSPRGVDALGHGRTLVTEGDGTFSLVKERWPGKDRVIRLGRLATDFPPAIAKGPHGWIYLLTGGGPPPGEEMRGVITAKKAPAAPATLFRWRKGWKKPRAVADIGAYQTRDPDPHNTEGPPTETNPFGLDALRDGSVLVADAAGNDLLRVWPRSGRIVTVARLKPRLVRVPEGLPEPPPEFGPLPPAGTPIRAEAVATSVTVGKDGYWYVGELRGFPATPGTSQIWRIKPGTRNATCRPNHPQRGKCKRFVDGLTSITDLASGDRGIYALELSKKSWLQWELGVPGGEIGGLFLVKKRGHHPRIRELVRNQLVTPGGVDVANRIYIVGPLFQPGALMKVR